jgi:hypothetical protein
LKLRENGGFATLKNRRANLTGDFSMVRAGKRVALYCRVSTKDKGQTTENQRRALDRLVAVAAKITEWN